MDLRDEGQVTKSAAEVYEEFFVPALFAPWVSVMADAAAIEPGQRVLDVGCGTGVLACGLAGHVDPGGEVVGLDLNPDMLTVARRRGPRIEWRQGAAEAMPFGDDGFDAVVSQFALMFFRDRSAAVREMVRVLRPGGRLAVAVWDAVERSPGYAAMVELLQRLFGGGVADALRAPFDLGDRRRLSSVFEDAGVRDFRITTRNGVARFPSIRDWVHTDVKGWTLADLIDDDQYRSLQDEAERDLQRFVTADGAVVFAIPAHVVTARG